MKKDNVLKRAVIAGASKALSIKERNSKATEQEIMQEITRSVNEIISKID
ncbi:MAG: hypothetical protein KKA64_03160 [Nanoarchaeota archaeon]|nr:hypothetical protein [Nanoarchaeota archaeon]